MEHEHGHFEHLLHSVDVVNLTTILSIIWFSFVMSWHCAAMCGPLACARFAQVTTVKERLWLHVCLYNLGRIIAYSLMGLTVAIASESIGGMLPLAGAVLATLFGVFVGVHGLFLIMNREVTWIPKLLVHKAARLVSWSSGLTGSSSSWMKTFTFGVVTVLLPCMTLASALAASAMSGDAVTGLLVMTGFAIGTVPVMAVLPLVSDNLASSLAPKLPLPMLRRSAGLFLIIVSGLTIFRIFH